MQELFAAATKIPATIMNFAGYLFKYGEQNIDLNDVQITRHH